MISTLNSSKICTAQKRQLRKALPIMAKAANTPELQSAFTAHLKEREEQLVRLNQIAEKLGKSLKGHTCAAIKALIAEGRLSRSFGFRQCHHEFVRSPPCESACEFKTVSRAGFVSFT
jgi:uncharacterized protein DUF892